jgi:hypothetical protein
MLDDPLQSDINLLGLVDVLRKIKARRQLILTTHDERFGVLLATRCGQLSNSTEQGKPKYVHLRGILTPVNLRRQLNNHLPGESLDDQDLGVLSCATETAIEKIHRKTITILLDIKDGIYPLLPTRLAPAQPLLRDCRRVPVAACARPPAHVRDPPKILYRRHLPIQMILNHDGYRQYPDPW